MRRERHSRHGGRAFPSGPVVSVEDWKAIEPAFAAGDRAAREWVYMQIWYHAVQTIAKRNRSKVHERYHDILDMAQDATVYAMQFVDGWDIGRESSLRSWAWNAARIAMLKAFTMAKSKKRWASSIEEDRGDGMTLGDIIEARPEPDPMQSGDVAEVARMALGSIRGIRLESVMSYYGIGRERKTLREIAGPDGVGHQAVFERIKLGMRQMAEYLDRRGITADMVLGD